MDVLEGFIDGKQAVHGDGSFLNFFIAALGALPDVESDAVYGQCGGLHDFGTDRAELR